MEFNIKSTIVALLLLFVSSSVFALDADQIITLSKSGLDNSALIGAIKAESDMKVISREDLAKMKSAGVSTSVVNHLLMNGLVEPNKIGKPLKIEEPAKKTPPHVITMEDVQAFEPETVQVEEVKRDLVPFDFNGVKWGDSKKTYEAKLKKAGWNAVPKQPGFMHNKISGEVVVANPTFVDGKLAQLLVLFRLKTFQKGLLPLFENVGELLTSKYGEPFKVLPTDSGKLSSDPDMAIAMGEMSIAAQFKAQDTNITLALWGEDGKPKVAIRYDGPLSQAADQQKTDAEASKL